MSSVPTNDVEDEKPGTRRIVAAIVLAVLSFAFIVVAIVYATTPENRLPGFLGFAHSQSRHTLWMAGSLLIGMAFAIGAWFALRYQSLALEEAREAERAALAEAEQAVGQGEQAPQPEGDPAPAQSIGTAKS